MERLTEEKQIGCFASLKDKSEAKPGAFADCNCFYAHSVAVTRLKAYEDTGLEPEDMKRAFNDDAVLKLAGQVLGTTADRIRELAEADKDGRLWMSPVPLVAGTKLYCPRKTDVQEQTLQYITLLDGEPTVSVSFECDYECDGCPHNAPYTNYDAGDGGCDGEGGFGLFNVSDVGKTVFLTSEEAEAALRGDKR